MNRILLLTVLSLLACVGVKASPQFSSSVKYRFVCKSYGTGAMVLGSNHSSTAYIYYDTAGESADDAWWYVEKGTEGYTLRNAKSGTYITYNAQRIDGVAKGLVLSTTATGTESEWTFTEKDNGTYTVANVQQPQQWWNVRKDGTYLVGTYTGSGTDNEVFTIYDENGNQVTETSGGSSSGSSDEREDFNAEKGITPYGEYWELQGIAQPVVYTTDASDPVLYSIANRRSGKYLYVLNNILYQSDDPESRAQFYFVEQNDGEMQMFTKEGLYVATTDLTSMGSYAVMMSEGTPSGQLWKLEWATDITDYPGYGVCRADNVATGDNGDDSFWGSSSSNAYNYWNDYNRSYVGYYSLDPGSTFVFTSSDQRHVAHLKQAGITFNGTGGGDNPDPNPGHTVVNLYQAVDSIRLADKDLIYDSTSKLYYHSIPSTLMDGGNYTTTLHFIPKAAYDGMTLQLNGQSIEGNTGEVTIEDVTCSQPYELKLLNDAGEEVAKASVQFTFMPIVEVRVPSCNGTVYTTGSIRVSDADIAGYDSVFVAAFRYRGATAQGYAKKAYAVKLRDEQGKSVDRSFFGLRSDNNWILDAMAVDPACMRNRVATDIWNDFSTLPYYSESEKKVRTGTRGHFVEVFLNGRYHGIYCMTEKMDRKQLKLKKFKAAADSKSGEDEVHGLLYKSSQWSYEVFMGHEQGSRYFPQRDPQGYSNKLGQETWAQYELKYPDYEEEAVDWEPLYNGVKFVATSSQDEFDSHVADYFDMPVLKDYYLFIDLLLATDNHGKNMFYYVYDRQGDDGDKLSLAPWDLDGTLGARWDGSTYYTSDYTQDFDNFLWSYEHGELTTYYKLKNSSTLNWSEQLAQRYTEIRQAHHFDPELLANRFASYARLFSASGADTREENRWGSTSVNHKDIQEAVTYAEEWIKGRVEALDAKYGFDPVQSAINEAETDAYFAVTGGDHALVMQSGTAREVRIYTLSGTLVRTVHASAGQTVVRGLEAGVYVVNGVKVVVK